MQDPAFGRRGHKRAGRQMPTESNHIQRKSYDTNDTDDLVGSIPMCNVKLGMEVVTMANALGHNAALFIFLRGCRFCTVFQKVWDEACQSHAPVLWLHCVVEDMDETSWPNGMRVSFPCLVANGRIHQNDKGASTSLMSTAEVVAFATRPMQDNGGVAFIEEGEVVEFPAPTGDLLSEHDDEYSEMESEATSSGEKQSSCGETDSDGDGDCGLGVESFIDEDDIDEQDGFQYTALSSDTNLAGPQTPVVMCYYWNACGGCKRFRPEWNTLVQQALDGPDTVHFAVVDIEKDDALFAKTGATTVPHIQLHTGKHSIHSTGPRSADSMAAWIQTHMHKA